MFRLDYFEGSGIILFSFITLILSQDRIIVSNTNLDVTDNNFSTESNVIPESLLIQLKDVQNVTDLLQRFITFDEDDIPVFRPSKRNSTVTVTSRRNSTVTSTSRRNSTVTSRRGLVAAAAAAVAQPANCQTEQHVIELDKPENGATIYWPSCVHVQRCGGCCTSKMLACKPVATSILNVTVLKMHYNLENPGSFESQGTRKFSVEQHDRCSCTCKEGPEDCDTTVHDYRANECRCVCKNVEQSASCTGPNKIWDSRSCSCRCRNTRICSSGRYFNMLNCRCEILRRSLATTPLNSTLIVPNSNTSLHLQVSTNSPV